MGMIGRARTLSRLLLGEVYGKILPGESIYAHSSRVASRCHSTDEITVAYLHDIVEDSPITIVELLDFFPTLIVIDVEMLTRVEGEEYSNYIDKIINLGSDTSLNVKIADNLDHLRDETKDIVPERLRNRYLKARELLCNERDRRGIRNEN